MNAPTLSGLKSRLDEFEERYGNEPLDTHIFASTHGIKLLCDMIPPAKRDNAAPKSRVFLDSILGLRIWNDPTIPDWEIHLGRVKWQDGAPNRIVTKVIALNA